MLTDKAKQDFEEWFKHEYPSYNLDSSEWYEDEKYWDDLSDSMQYGVYVDFFDSVGIVVGLSAYKGFAKRDCYRVRVGTVEGSYRIDPYPTTRTEARQKAIEKAQEIYNNRI